MCQNLFDVFTAKKTILDKNATAFGQYWFEVFALNEDSRLSTVRTKQKKKRRVSLVFRPKTNSQAFCNIFND